MEKVMQVVAVLFLLVTICVGIYVPMRVEKQRAAHKEDRLYLVVEDSLVIIRERDEVEFLVDSSVYKNGVYMGKGYDIYEREQ